MQDPILVISFEDELAHRIRRVFRKSGEDIEVYSGSIPATPPRVRGVVITAGSTTDIDAIIATMKPWNVPIFLVSDSNPSPPPACFSTTSDRIEVDLLVEVRRRTAHDVSTFTVWTSDSMAQIQRTIERIGPTTLPVLITGESGTGKEVVARALHSASNRSTKQLVVVDCAAIAPTLMESELFGHQKGAFTGASTSKRGLVQHANNSTFFLDEIGELPTPVQVKLLRLLQDGSYRPVGSSETRASDLRIIAATNRDIEAGVTAGEFRRDLYHRLHGARIHIPPLRERTDDIEPLFRRYLQHFCTTLQRPPLRISASALQVLETAQWPGNVRELVNCANFVASLVQSHTVEPADLPPSLHARGSVPTPGFIPVTDRSTPISSIRTDLSYKDAKREWLAIFEAQYVQAILDRNDGNVSAAAKEAGIDRRSIQRIVRRIKSAFNDESDG